MTNDLLCVLLHVVDINSSAVDIVCSVRQPSLVNGKSLDDLSVCLSWGPIFKKSEEKLRIRSDVGKS